MKLTTPFFSIYIRIFFYALSAIFIAGTLDMSMQGDGLRHIAFAAHPETMKSWAEVYPFSLFGEYDPWHSWHNLLRFFLSFTDVQYLHIVINSIVLFFLMLLLEQYLYRYIKYDFAALIFPMVLILLSLSYVRYVNMRPDLLSGLYVLYALLLLNRNQYGIAFIVTLLYASNYYLFFLYTGTIGLTALVQRKKYFFFSIFLASLSAFGIHLLYDFSGYIQTVTYILNDQTLREGLQVSEGQSLFPPLSYVNYYLLLLIFLFLSILLIRKYQRFFKYNEIATYLLVSAILWIGQVRYFLLFLPLFNIFILSLFINSNKKQLLYQIRRIYIVVRQSLRHNKKKKKFYREVIIYFLVCAYIFFDANSHHVNFKIRDFYADRRFDNTTIVSSKMYADIYFASYLNPSIHIIPSCSIGWFDDRNSTLKDIYIKMQGIQTEPLTEKELLIFLKNVQADYYIHYPEQGDSIYLNLNELSRQGLDAVELIDNRILFKVNFNKGDLHERR